MGGQKAAPLVPTALNQESGRYRSAKSLPISSVCILVGGDYMGSTSYKSIQFPTGKKKRNNLRSDILTSMTSVVEDYLFIMLNFSRFKRNTDVFGNEVINSKTDFEVIFHLMIRPCIKSSAL